VFTFISLDLRLYAAVNVVAPVVVKRLLNCKTAEMRRKHADECEQVIRPDEELIPCSHLKPLR
jgi:hypothetical protein